MGNKHPKQPNRSQSQQQVLGGVKRRSPNRAGFRGKPDLCKGVCLDPKDLGLASLRAQTRAAVSGIAELGRKDVERVLSRTLARTSLPWPHWTSERSPEFAKAADACGTLRRRKRAKLRSLGDSALREEKGVGTPRIA